MKHTDDHLAEVCSTLGIPKSDGNAGLAGIEIETGWQTEAKRSNFFRDLDRFGVGNEAISKFDGSVGKRDQTLTAELVSRPMTFTDLRKYADKIGKVIESKVDKGLVTMGAGVHIHVSEGMFNTDALWRYAASICHDADAMEWWKPQQGVAEGIKMSRIAHSFWDDISLRSPSKYHMRTPYRNVREIPKTTEHKRAFIHGATTPTYETRIFRTPKSRRVLLSYIDAVESLLEFSTVAPANLIGRAGVDLEVVRKIEQTTAKELGITHNPVNGGMIVYDLRTGEQFNLNGVKIVNTARKPYAFNSNDALRLPTQAELEMLELSKNYIGAKGWASGVIPVPAYIKFVIERQDKYPHLAQRLKYDKFSIYTGEKRPDEFIHRDKEHLEFRIGCLVRIEENRGGVYEITNMFPSRGNRYGMASCKVKLSTEVAEVNEYEYPINALIHACKGALEPGGEL